MYDVVVVGGGPVGSYVAYKLAEVGYGVAVLEQKERVGEPVCCAGIIGQECVRAFNIDNKVILRRANSARLFFPSGRWLRIWRKEPQAVIVDRAAFDMTMVNRAQNKGAEYRLNTLVTDIKVEDNRVRVEATRQGEGLSLEARAVVVATGFGSRLIERLGLGKVGDSVTGAQAEVETVEIDEVEVYFGQEMAPGFFAWLVPTSPARALVGLLSRHSPELYLKKLVSSLLAQGKIVSAEIKPCYRGIPLRPMSRTWGNRLMVLGAAAGQVKPTTGGGIYYGLLCADIAANSLHRALVSDALSAKNLAGYEREWKRRLGRELKIGYWARRLYEHLSDRQVDRLFDIIKSSGVDEALLKTGDLSFDWHSEVVLRLLAHRAIAKAIEAMKIPWYNKHRV